MAGLAIGLAFLTAFGFGASAVVVWAGVAIVLRLRSQVSFAGILLVMLAAVGGTLLASHDAARSLTPTPTGAFEGAIRVIDGPFLTLNGQRFTGEANSIPGNLLCVYAAPKPRPNAGDVVFATGRVTQLVDMPEIGRAAAKARNCDAQLRLESFQIVRKGEGVRAALSRYRTQLSDFLMRSAPGDTGALLSGLVTGDDGALSTDASDAFLSSGTTHITAISGANFAMIILVLGLLATGAVRRSLGFVVVVSVLVWAYALLVGLQPSAFRAALLATAVLIGRRLGRAPDLLTLTVCLAAVQVLVRPHDFGSLAFQLSLAATIALVVVFDGRERDNTGSWTSSLMLSVFAAQLATLPVLAAQIGAVSGIGLLANLMVGPLAAVAFPLAFVGALIGQIDSTLGNAALTPAIALARLMISIVLWSHDHLPGAVQLGEPTTGANAVLTIAAWTAIFWMSGDLRRMARHGRNHLRDW